MRTALTVLRLVLRRSRANWRLLSTVVVGVVLSSALLASVAIYSDAVRDLGLSYALEQEPDQQLDVRVLNSSHRFSPSLYDERAEALDATLEAQAGDVFSDVVHYGKSDTFFPAPVGESPDSDDEDRPRAHFQFTEELQEHTELVAGEWPGEPGETDGIPHLEVLLGAAAAEQHGLEVGDTFDIHPFWVQEPQPVRVTISGLLEPQDPQARHWYDIDDRFIEEGTRWPTYPFWVDQEVLTGALASYLPAMGGNFETFGIVDRGFINSSNAEGIANRLGTMDRLLKERIPRTTVDTTLPGTLETYQDKLFFTRLPLFALMLQVAGIVLFYLVMVSTMLVDRQTGEIALLRSRGASPRQVMGIYAVEGGLLALGATIAGPLLAALAISMLGVTPAFSDLSGGEPMDVRFSSWAIGLAALGALMALGALLFPAWRMTRRSMVDYRQGLARPPQQPAFLRYYLDLVVVGVAAYAFYQLQERGSLVTDRLFGGLQADPLLLAAPTLFMLMVALVFLRLFPVLLGFVSWLGRGLPGATIPLGLWHMVRSPASYSRLILLLLLATAVGVFAASFRATLERSYDDRSSYEAGAPLRIEDIRNQDRQDSAELRTTVEEATGSEDVSPVARLSGSYQLSDYRYEGFSLLGVHPDEFADISYWRGDFAGPSLDDLLTRLEGEPPPMPEIGIIPAEQESIGIWARVPDGGEGDILPGLRVEDSTGRLWEYRLEPMTEPTEEGWQFFAAGLGEAYPRGQDPGPDYSGESRIDSVYARAVVSPATPQRATVVFDEVLVGNGPPVEGESALGDTIVVEDFENIAPYSVLASGARGGETTSLTQVEGGDDAGGFAAELSFLYGAGRGQIFGLRPASDLDVVPVLANDAFFDNADVEEGEQFPVFLNSQYITLQVVGTFDYFPTWDPREDSFLFVANLDLLADVGSRLPFSAGGLFPNEAWIGDPPAGGLTEEEVRANGLPTGDLVSQAALRAEAGSDPLVAASWEGILFLAFAAVLVLTALGFIVYSYLTAQTRRLEFAILRTMGFSGKQILGLVSFEQVFVIGAGVLVGTLLGMPLGRLMIGYMGVTETGEDILPPLVSQVSWAAVLTVYSLLAVVFVATIAALAALYSRLAVHRALRMGDL